MIFYCESKDAWRYRHLLKVATMNQLLEEIQRRQDQLVSYTESLQEENAALKAELEAYKQHAHGKGFDTYA